MTDVLAGRRHRIRHEISSRLLAVTSDARSGYTLVDAGPTARAIEDLLELGYGPKWIAHQLGSPKQRLYVARHRFVRLRTERAVLALVERVGHANEVSA